MSPANSENLRKPQSTSDNTETQNSPVLQGAHMLDSGSDSDSDSDSDSTSDCGSDPESFIGIEELIRSYDEDKLHEAEIQQANPFREPNGQDAASNHDVTSTKAATPMPYLTSDDSQQQSNNQQSNRRKNSAASTCEHSPNIQACGSGQGRKRTLSDHVSETDSQSGESRDTAIVVEEETPRRRRKTNHKKFHDHVDRENFWMVHTMRRIEKALKVCDKLDKDIDKEQERQDKRRQKVKKQKEILEGTTKYIISCGANEQKITRRWEKS